MSARDQGETVGECLEAFAAFFGEYRDCGVQMSAPTVVEFERLFRDLSDRAKEAEAASRRLEARLALAMSVGAAVPSAAETAAATAEALAEPDSNVALFPVVRRSPPPRDPSPRPAA